MRRDSTKKLRLGWQAICLGILAIACILPASTLGTTKIRKTVEFNRDIRPILSKCLACHGQDPKAIQAGLQLNIRAKAIAKLGNGDRAIVPFHPEKSALVERVFAKDDAERMPPTYSNKTLSLEERNLLKRWIAEGAEYKEHWAFVPPARPPLPKVHLNWTKNAIDTFVLAKLEENGLRPSPLADRRTLIRRVSLDLTGLPPAPQEVAAFVKDKSPNAYEKVVDRLLKSPRYGERMAMDWMDYARYADSNGYQADWERFQWRWRDWVINAFNNNMPYDQFTVEQLAGDLLPNATLEQRIATGFNRNHRINTEGGVVAEEWRVEAIIDRVETTSAVWLGLTAGCARCHDHKYDPLSQKEFYGLFAYFNNVPESGTGEERPVNHPPVLKAPYPEQLVLGKKFDSELAILHSQMKALLALNATSSRNWRLPEPAPAPLDGLVARYDVSASAKDPALVRGHPKFDPGRSAGAIRTGEQDYLDLGNVGDFDSGDSFSYGAWINPENGNGAPISRMDPKNAYRGWDMFLAGGRVSAHLIDQWPDNALKVISKKMLPNGEWSHVFVTYDGSKKPEGLKIYLNGKPLETEIETNKLTGTLRTKVTAKIGRRTDMDQFAGLVDDPMIYRRALGPEEVARLADVHPARRLLSVPPENRTKLQQTTLDHLWSREHDPAFRKLDDRNASLTAKKAQLEENISTVMVMAEMDPPRNCFVLVRGQYDKHGSRVEAGVPASLPPLPKGVPNNRLGLAKWIVSPQNPLTARVTVNRMWERLFGNGIVSTVEDFGTRAEFPSHPELLDWLATEFVRLKWDQKAIWKEMVMSATYRQRSDVSAKMAKLDPQNRLLARGPRFRLTGETLRDQALAAGGLLVHKIGGPSVRPYQPEGIWDEVNVYGNLRNYKHDEGPGLHRRSLYTIWKRTAAPPDMTLFDVPSREACRVRRARTDTPLQALAMLNDVTYLEAARALAQRMLKEGGPTAVQRLRFAFGVLLSREPTPVELGILKASVARRLAHYAADRAGAEKLLKQGDLPNDPTLDHAELAAYTVVASTILNLDEVLNKE